MDDDSFSGDDKKVIQLDDYRNDGPEIGADSEPQEPSGDFGDPIPQEEDFDYVREPGKGKNGHRPIRWLRVREFYMKNQDVNFSQVAAKYGIALGNLCSRARKEDWKNKRRVYYLETSQLLDANHADLLVKHRLEHANVTGGVIRILQAIVNEIEKEGFLKADGSEITSTMTRVEIASTLALAALKASEGDRLNLGLKPGETSSEEAKDSTLIIETRELVPEKVPVNQEGRALKDAS